MKTKERTITATTMREGTLGSNSNCCACHKDGLQLFEITIGNSITRLCEDCLDELRHAAFDALTGRC